MMSERESFLYIRLGNDTPIHESSETHTGLPELSGCPFRILISVEVTSPSALSALLH